MHLHQRARLLTAVSLVEFRPHNELVVALEEEPHRVHQLIGGGGRHSGGPVVGLRKTQLHRHRGFGRWFGPLQEPCAGQVAALRRQRLTAILQCPERRLRRQHDHAGRGQGQAGGARKAGAVLEQQLDETGGRNGEEGGCHQHVAERSDPLTQHQGKEPGWKHQDDERRAPARRQHDAGPGDAGGGQGDSTARTHQPAEVALRMRPARLDRRTSVAVNAVVDDLLRHSVQEVGHRQQRIRCSDQEPHHRDAEHGGHRAQIAPAGEHAREQRRRNNRKRVVLARDGEPRRQTGERGPASGRILHDTQRQPDA